MFVCTRKCLIVCFGSRLPSHLPSIRIPHASLITRSAFAQTHWQESYIGTDEDRHQEPGLCIRPCEGGDDWGIRVAFVCKLVSDMHFQWPQEVALVWPSFAIDRCGHAARTSCKTGSYLQLLDDGSPHIAEYTTHPQLVDARVLRC